MRGANGQPLREIHCHTMVRSVAIEMAGALYDEMMRDNAVYEGWKEACPDLDPILAEAKFIELLWPLLVRNGSARATLARTLTSPDIDYETKMSIHSALCLDATLSRGRKQGPRTPRRLKVNLDAE